jgi:hypothetical protein
LFFRVVDEIGEDVLVRVRTNWQVVATHVDRLDAESGQKFEISEEVVWCGRNGVKRAAVELWVSLSSGAISALTRS